MSNFRHHYAKAMSVRALFDRARRGSVHQVRRWRKEFHVPPDARGMHTGRTFRNPVLRCRHGFNGRHYYLRQTARGHVWYRDDPWHHELVRSKP